MKLNYIKYTILSLSILSFGIFFDSHFYKELGNYAWILLLIIMFSRPILDIFRGKNLLTKILSYIVILRKELGITASIFVIGHTIGFFLERNLGINYLTSSELWSLYGYIGWGTLAFLVCLILFLTSNVFSQKVLGIYWKKIQRLSYLMFVFSAIHIGLIHNGREIIPMISIIILYSVLYFLAYRSKQIPHP